MKKSLTSSSGTETHPTRGPRRMIVSFPGDILSYKYVQLAGDEHEVTGRLSMTLAIAFLNPFGFRLEFHLALAEAN